MRRDHREVTQLVIEESLPDPFDARVALLRGTGGVVVDLGGLVQQPLLEDALLGIGERLVLRHVLLLDGGDLRVQLTRPAGSAKSGPMFM